MKSTRFARWVTVAEMAQIMDVSIMTVRNMIKRGGILPPVYNFGVKRFTKSDVEKFISNGYVWKEAAQ